jgi:hypothetical protein
MPINPEKLLINIAGDGFKIFPIVKLISPTLRLEILLKTLPKVTLLPDTVHVKEVTATESTVIDRQVTAEELKENTDGNVNITVAVVET